MLEITRKSGPFLVKEIWFSRRPFTVTGCDSVIFKNCEERVSLDGFEVEEFTTSVINLAEDPEIIWKNMSSSCRKEIRRAERYGVSVRTSEDFEEFSSMYRSFMRAKGLGAWIGRRRFVDYVRNGTLFAAELGGRMIAGHLYFDDGRQMRWVMAPSRRFDRHGDQSWPARVGEANRLAVWEAIKYAKNAGMATFDLGGIYTGKDQSDPRYGINQFKFQFGGKLVTVYNYNMCHSGALRIARRIERLLAKVQTRWPYVAEA